MAAYKNKGKEESQLRLQPLPKLGLSIVPAEIMLQRQKVEEEEQRKQAERRLVDQVLANINESDPSSDNPPAADTPPSVVAAPESVTETAETPAGPPEDQEPGSRSSSRGDEMTSPLDAGAQSPELEPVSSPPPGRSSPAEMATPPPAASEPAPVPDSTASPPDPSQPPAAAGDPSAPSTEAETFTIQSMTSSAPGHTIQTTYNNSYNYHYPHPGGAHYPGYAPYVDMSLPPPGYSAPYYPGHAVAPYSAYSYPDGKGKTYLYDDRSEEERWRRDRRYGRDRDRYEGRRHRHRSRSYERRERGHRERHGRDRERYERRSRSRERRRSREREREERRLRSRSTSRDRGRRLGSREQETARDRSGSREGAGRGDSKEKADSGEKGEDKTVSDTISGDKDSQESSEEKDDNRSVDKKEEARLKLKELINKNRDKVEDVKRKKERDEDRDRKVMQAELERERRTREHETDGDWHCGDAECRFINFKKNRECKKCGKPPPDVPVFWDVPALPEPVKKKKEKKEKKSKSSKESKSKRDSSQDSLQSKESQDPDEDLVKDARPSSRPSSRSQVTSFLDDLGDSFDDDIKKHLGQSSTFPTPVSTEIVASKPEVNDDENETEKSESFKPKDSTTLETISSQDLDDSILSNASDSNAQSTKGEFLEPKYSWKDRSNTSGEFELSLEINDKDFLDTVKNEYRSSSPSWANTKFTFPMKDQKVDKKTLDKIPTLSEEVSAERAVSVRKRMEDEIKKEHETKSDSPGEEERSISVTDISAGSIEVNQTENKEALKIKSDSLKHKDRQYRSSRDDALKGDEVDQNERDRKKYEEDKYDRKKREERQRDRDRKDRERNEKIREEEERRRRRKIEEEEEEDRRRRRKVDDERKLIERERIKLEEERRRVEEKKREEERRCKHEEEEKRRKIEEDENRRR